MITNENRGTAILSDAPKPNADGAAFIYSPKATKQKNYQTNPNLNPSKSSSPTTYNQSVSNISEKRTHLVAPTCLAEVSRRRKPWRRRIGQLCNSSFLPQAKCQPIPTLTGGGTPLDRLSSFASARDQPWRTKRQSPNIYDREILRR